MRLSEKDRLNREINEGIANFVKRDNVNYDLQPIDLELEKEIRQEIKLFDEKQQQNLTEQTKGFLVEAGEGLSFGLLGEAYAAITAATTEKDYLEALDAYEDARDEFKRNNPNLANAAFGAELLTSIMTGAGIIKGLNTLGIKSLAKQGAIEGGMYGAFSGESIEERATLGSTGVLLGGSIGKVVDIALTPSSLKGLRKESDDNVDFREAPDAPDIDDVPTDFQRKQREAAANKILTAVYNPIYMRKPLKEAKTAGEFYEGVKTAVGSFYTNKIFGISDSIQMDVSPEVGALVARVFEVAQKKTSVATNKLFSDNFMQAIQKTVDDETAMGAFLDYGAGHLGKTRDESLKNLREILLGVNKSYKAVTDDEMFEIAKYLNYSTGKNNALNKTVFGATFREDQSHLHTRLVGDKLKEKSKVSNAEDIQDFIEDRGFLQRTRGKYTDNEGAPNRPNPMHYEHPIISDLKRLNMLEILSEISQKFGMNVTPAVQAKRLTEVTNRNVEYAKALNDVSDAIKKEEPISEIKRLSKILENAEVRVAAIEGDPKRNIPKMNIQLTPKEFMQEFEDMLVDRGLTREGAQYSRKLVSDEVMGLDATPHPAIQAINSFAYATTLAGPMSAILNLADAPLVGAKHGGRASLAAIKMASPFKKPAMPELDALGLDNQTMGEFINQANLVLSDKKDFLSKTAKRMREGTDFLMKGSTFRFFDEVGKKGVMRGVLVKAADDAAIDAFDDTGKKIGTKLRDNWSFYFNDVELDVIEKQLRKHGANWDKYTGPGKELIEELMVSGLGQQQLISAAGRSAAWARNPNLRPLWALRGFVIKQQALALREVMGNLKAGKPKEAVEFLGRYAALGAGGYAIINESRQFVFGDGNASFGGLVRGYGDAWASLLTLNTLGLNDYQFGQIQKNGILFTLAEGLVPLAIDRPFDIGGRLVDALDGDRYFREVAADALPIIKQTTRGVRNVEGMFNLGVTEPIGQAAETILERKPRD